MVHRGPAKGCSTCKGRHIKCDLERPHCRRCVKRGLECPGYGHQLDIVLRNETSKFTGEDAPSRHVSSNTDIQQVLKPKVLSQSPGIQPLLEDGARGWFFSNFILPQQKDWRTSHGHFDQVLPLFQKVPLDSLFPATLTWLAVVMIGTSVCGRPSELEHRVLSKVVKQLRAALSDPLTAKRNETLHAILLLQFGEDIKAQRYFDQERQVTWHQQAAEALIKDTSHIRGDKILKSLRASVRHNWIECSLFEPLTSSDLRFKAVCPDHLDSMDFSETPAALLDACGVTSLEFSKRAFHASKNRDPLVLEELQADFWRMWHEIQSWDQCLVTEWMPVKESHLRHIYPSADVCFIFAQWYLIQLKAISLFPSSKPQTENIFGNDIVTLMNDITAMEASFLDQAALELRVVKDSVSNLSSALPGATSSQCRQGGTGVRFLDLILRRLIFVLGEIKNKHQLADDVNAQVTICTAWARRELGTIRKAFPMQKVDG